MDSSKYSEFKEKWKVAVEAGFAFDYDTSVAWLPVRDSLFEAGVLDGEIMEIDKMAIQKAVKEGSDRPYRRDHEDLTRWWWHLEKIASGQYPVELLPEYLKEIYLKALRGDF
ncbi:hypothetical protein [Thermodesulfovibrio yellowstonii]|uniref:hypothetical protein n=1 Tax=Thermodesulfovibrio yellowstonii TaxID=28262 RepID=UPI0024B37CBC|nr:hypothetical protein [Thermodesulfovibrio yellowstonii]MDI6865773.1 hypothetical protein [Thermodesulfovibrio yellowstonii]